MKSLGIDSYEELLVYMEDNPEEEIVIELKEILSLIDYFEGDN